MSPLLIALADGSLKLFDSLHDVTSRKFVDDLLLTSRNKGQLISKSAGA